MVDPLLQMCSVSASRLNTLDMAAYMINCICLMKTSLALYEYTDSRLEMLQAQVCVTLLVALYTYVYSKFTES